MDVIGKWKFVEARALNAEGSMVWMGLEDYRKSDFFDAEEPFQVIDCLLEFCEDGFARLLLPVPEGVPQEEIDAAQAAGRLYGGMMVMDTNAWKQEDGKIMIDSKTEGEIMGESVDPWVELRVEGDTLEYMGMFRIAKA